MKISELTLTIKIEWWVIPSLHLLTAFCLVTRYQPDAEKLADFYGRHGFIIRENFR